MTNFGFELECRSNAQAVLTHLHAAGLSSDSRLHHYHCRCPKCDYNATSYLFMAQQDCTVDGEIISTILEHGSARHHRAVQAVTTAMLMSQASTEGQTGLHVHVDKSTFSTRRQKRILFRLFARYADELREIAAGGHSKVRDYNQPPYTRGFDWTSLQIPNCGSWLVEKSSTYEFRLWNATRSPHRLNLAIGLSVAMVKAALDRADTRGPKDDRPIEAILAPYMDDETWGNIIRQRFLKGGMGNA